MYVYLMRIEKMKSLRPLLILYLLLSFALQAQETESAVPAFMLKGQVIDAEDDTPIDKVNIEINGKEYTTTNKAGEFTILASIGDELIIKSDAFNTAYYTVEDRQRVTVRVEKARIISKIPSNARKKTKANTDYFTMYIDSAKQYLKQDAKKSIEYVTQALELVQGKRSNRQQQAIAFETLGDINGYWQQHDLSVSNYKRSLEEVGKIDVRLKLAAAYRNTNNYQESITTYEDLLKEKLASYEQVEVYEGLGDTYNAIDDGVKSVFNYQKGLDIAKDRKITPKITDLNSKIGEAYARSGATQEASEYFTNSLDLAGRENKKRAATEKNKVADFYNQSQDFDKEIELREETLDDIQSLEEPEEERDLKSPLTVQRQNYKIANAYVAQDKYEEAIPFLERSIEQADAEEDLVVQKDATRKLSEIYRDIGDYGKSAENYERYVAVVDELYVKKEQELSQAARFSKEIALKQNRITSLETEKELNDSRYQLAFENQELIEKNSKVQQWIIGSLGVIALLLLYTAYNQRKTARQQKYANNLLALKSLRTQMNPHFIFNALNSVNSFIASSDERAANKYLSEFSQLMRSVLENSEEDFIPLAKEIELLELYTKLEHFRFKDKFEYTISVDEAMNVSDFVIPPMLLQPYVENAVWHGLRYKEEKGNLAIRFDRLDSETVEITIEDDGIGRDRSKELKTDHQKKQKSKGMGNIKKRIAILNEMYKDKVDVHISDLLEDASGTKVQLILKKD